MVLSSSAIVVTSQHKPTVRTLLNYEVSMLRHNIVYLSRTIAVKQSVGPCPVFVDGKVRATATVVDTINEQLRVCCHSVRQPIPRVENKIS